MGTPSLVQELYLHSEEEAARRIENSADVRSYESESDGEEDGGGEKVDISRGRDSRSGSRGQESNGSSNDEDEDEDEDEEIIGTSWWQRKWPQSLLKQKESSWYMAK